MKKSTYYPPQLAVFEQQLSHSLLAGSEITVDTTSSDSPGNSLGRSFDIDDDEDF